MSIMVTERIVVNDELYKVSLTKRSKNVDWEINEVSPYIDDEEIYGEVTAKAIGQMSLTSKERTDLNINIDTWLYRKYN